MTGHEKVRVREGNLIKSARCLVEIVDEDVCPTRVLSAELSVDFMEKETSERTSERSSRLRFSFSVYATISLPRLRFSSSGK